MKYMFPDTFLRAARLAFLTWRSPVVCVIALRSHCIAPGASHFTPAAVVSFGNVADASWVLVERTSSLKALAAARVSAGAREPGELREGQRGEGGVFPYVDRRRGDEVGGREGRDGGGGHPQVSSQGLDAGEVQGCRLCVSREDDVHAVELAVAVHRDAARVAIVLDEIRHATRYGACGTLTVDDDGVDGDGHEREGDERDERHARHGAWRRRSGHARAFYWRHFV